MPSVTVAGLKRLCLTNVIELKFRRRIYPGKNGGVRTRRMLCTLDPLLLNGALGKKVLNFKKPTQLPPYNAAAKNLVIVWDIFRQNWRSVPVESVDVVSMISTRPQKTFWEYFTKVLSKMTATQKQEFFDK